MDSIIKIFLVIYVLSIFIPIGNSQDGSPEIPPEIIPPSPPTNLIPPDGSDSGLSKSSKSNRDNNIYSGRSDGSSHDNVYISIPDPNSQIEITKLLKPDLKTTYLVGDELVIIVEIKNLNNKDIYGLSICERVDDNLEIVNGSISSCYITKFANVSSRIINILKDNKTINNMRNATPIISQKQGIIEIYIDRLPIKGRAIYCYKIKPIKEGNFFAATILSFKDKNYPDYEYYLKNECEKLDTISVLVKPDKTNLYVGCLGSLGGGSSTKIDYTITYFRQLSQNSGKKLKGKFLESEGYYNIDYITYNGSYFEDPNLNDNEKPFEIEYGHNCVVTIGITYLKENVADAPIIFLDEMPKVANTQTIIIESFIWSHIEFFAALFSAIILIGIEFLILKHQNHIMQIQSGELKDLSTKITPEFSKMNDNINLISKELHIVVTKMEDASALTARELRQLHDDIIQIYNEIKK